MWKPGAKKPPPYPAFPENLVSLPKKIKNNEVYFHFYLLIFVPDYQMRYICN